MNPDTATTADIEKTMELDASPSRVWAALTDPERLAAWFPDRVDGLEPAQGAEGWLEWERHGRYAITIEAMEPERRLVWRWARESETPLQGGYNTRVEWRLEAIEGGRTRLHLTEGGFRTEADREDNVAGWKHELVELADYLNGRDA